MSVYYWNNVCKYLLMLQRVCDSVFIFFFFSSRRRHTRLQGDWSSDVCSSDLKYIVTGTTRDRASGSSASGSCEPEYAWRRHCASASARAVPAVIPTHCPVQEDRKSVV